ncbi:YkyB family protein [Neobacillus niacini]|uniref:YkyB family protein n=1 Tax=Neobacillus niacini TaxID=86668 RepID=UPI002FFDBBEA
MDKDFLIIFYNNVFTFLYFYFTINNNKDRQISKIKGVPILTDDKKNPYTKEKLTIDNLSQALFIVNRHAKTAPNPKFLYKLKHETLKKLLEEGKAKKLGLHFSKNPRNSKQQSDVLIECGHYTFHIPPTKSDFAELPHLGKLDGSVRNPKSSLSLNFAKNVLQAYTGIMEIEEPPSNQRKNRPYQKPIFKKLGERYT